MKLTKKLEAEVLKAYHIIWDAYLKGDMRTFASMLDEKCYIIGSAAGEVFNNKKAAVKYYKSTAEQITGKAELRNRKVNVLDAENGFIVNEESDFYLLIDDQWTFYGPVRISSLLHKKNDKWKVIHQHGSFPDSKTEGGEQVNAEIIKAENIQLRDAVKRRTVELEQKNRELEIEAALERVRSRAMAMHKTDELLDAAEIVHKELSALGINSMNVSYAFVDEDEKYGSYYSVNPVDGRILPIPFVFPHTETEVMRSILSSWKKQESFNVIELKEKATLKHQTYIGEHIQQQLAKNNIPFSIGEFLAISPKKAVLSTFNFSNGYLFNIGGERLSKSQEELMLRFTRVFEQTYTRFLDLQKAEAQTKEAQIEASLERIRAKAMAMHKSEDLNSVVATVFEELGKLNLGVLRCGIGIFNKEKRTGDIWSTSLSTQGTTLQISGDESFDIHPLLRGTFDAWLDQKDFSYELEGKDLNDYYEALTKTNFNLPASPPITLETKRAKQYYYTPTFKAGNLYAFSEIPFAEDAKKIMNRFAGVLNLTYNRFLDLQKAEAQARESQIQLAMERVRARTMAMQRSEELMDAASLLFQQVQALGTKQWASGFDIWLANEASATAWMANPDGSLGTPFIVPYTKDPFFKNIYAAMQRGEDFYVMESGGKELKETYQYMFNLPDAKKHFDVIANLGFQIPTFQITHCAFFPQGFLMFITYEPCPEMWDIFKRFAKVFEQTYTRFLDLQKAEAQAKEAQIEVALERVRARAMAMHSADELIEVANVLREQMGLLGQPELETMAVHLYSEDSENFNSWYAFRPNDNPTDKIFRGTAVFKKDSCEIVQEFVGDYYAGKKEYTVEVSGKKREEWFNVLIEAAPLIMESVYERLDGIPEKTYFHFTDFSGGSLLMVSYQPPSEESCNLQRRATAVFDLAYRRFLDLQKAEAQAKEAQIEASLERVRSRAMAMQTSEELNALIGTVFIELTKLDLVLTRCVILIYEGNEKGVRWWMANSEAPSTPMNFFVKYADLPFFNEYLKGWHERSLKWQYILEGEDKIRTDKVLFNETELSLLPDFVIAGMKANNRVYLSASFNNYGCLNLASLEPLSDEHFDILLRFAKVFDLTYTRFNDLKQAEAQAKESRIQLALERVRARTMAMQKSDELAEAAQLLYEEFRSLNINTFLCGYCFYKEEQNIQTVWVTTPDGTLIPDFTDFPLEGDHVLNKRYEDWKQKKPLHVLEIKDEVNKEHHQFLASAVPRQIAQEIFAQIPDRIIFYCANFSAGYLFIIATEFLSKQEEEVITRFAKVFELSYTRFSDLKQAEAQAREAKIEAALERVRARAMAMHESQELKDVALELRNQMGTMAQPELEVCAIHLYEESPDYFDAWAAIRPPGDQGNIIPLQARFPKRGVKIVDEMMRAYYEGKKDYVLVNEGEKLVEWFDQLKEQVPEGFRMVLESLHGIAPQDSRTYWSLADFQGGALVMTTYISPNDEARKLLRRFANVFGLAYRRFVDLKQAEAQTREAQIELALERVRARTMAMHKSDELAEVVGLLFKQFEQLGFELYQLLISIYDTRNKIIEWWSKGFGDIELPQRNIIPIIDHPFPNDLLDKWKNGTEYYAHTLEGEIKKSWDEYLFTQTDLKHFPQEVKDMMRSVDKVFLSDVFMKYGSIQAAGPVPLPDDKASILKRFAKVLDQAYTRMTDLQNAEAQAREARIETALEKVRSRSLAMHKSDELQEVVNTVFERLKELGVEMDSANIAIFKEGTRDYDYWIASPVQKRSASFHMPYIDLSLTKDLIAARESGKDFSTAAYSFEEKNEWFDYAFKHTDFQFLNEERKQFILNAPAITVAIAFSKHTGVQINKYNSKLLTEGEAEVLKRFSKVFEQAYIRFLDLEKAEAQGKEARIEIALERIRARALAMHKSDELMEVAKVLREQMALLGQPELEASVVHLYEEDPDHILSWRAFRATDSHSKIAYGHMSIPKNSCEFVREWLTKFYSELKEYTIELTGAKQEEWYDLFFKLAPDVINSMRQEKSIHEKRYYRFSKFSGGALLMVSKQEPSAEVAYLQSRAAVVFDLAYRRFSDLQKAEAQARESQIEASLERVRSKTMAMHNSQDVADTVSTTFDELVKLGIQTLRCGVGILHENYHMELWTAKPDEAGKVELIVGHLDMKLHPLLTGGYNSWKDKRDSFSYELKEDDLIAYFNAINNYPGYPIKYDIASLPSQIFHNEFHFNEGTLFSFSLNQLSTESSQIFKRFAGVFGQTYRRYLDLQKAEAQARDAQIEASLERVRSKTMAMHNSQDVGDTVAAMFDELVKLGVETVRCGIGIMHEHNQMEVWTARKSENEKVELIIGRLDMTIHPLLQGMYNGWKNKDTTFSYELKGSDLVDYFTKLINSPDYHISYDIASLPQQQFQKGFFFPEGALFAFSAVQLSTEAAQIFKRFAGVFGQTYRRYLDLQKAEAQAREAKIEASLERVRAKAMAMHKSDDLHGAVTIMFEEFQKLNLNVLRCGIGILNKDSRTGSVWTTSVSDNGLAVQISADESFDTHPLMMLIYEYWQKQEELDYVLQGQDLINYYRAMDASELKLPKSQLFFSDDELQPQYYYAAMFNAGGLYSFRDKPFAAEDKKIMKRFASVVNLTYNRFLDLQKAEAQAREAKIEASLERVRAKAMAMHKSEDLNSAVATVFEELDKLDLGVLRCGISILDKEKRMGDIWVTSITDQGSAVQVSGDESFDINPLLQGAFEAWLKREDFSYLLEGDDLAQYYKAVKAANFQLPESQLITSETESKKQYFFAAQYGAGGLFAVRETEFPEEAKTVMKRFAGVFDLTYKRFLDLQKAEANAREAKIEGALEKVRARAMAMHNSNDLSSAASVVFTELSKLGINPVRSGVSLQTKNSRKNLLYYVIPSTEGDSLSLAGTALLDGHPVLSEIYDSWVRGEDYYPVLKGELLISYYQILKQVGFDVPASTAEHEQYGYYLPFSEGMFYGWSEKPFDNAEKNILKRFASVIGLTFKRYFDLQKAEANAREAQIEAGLERVRAKTMAMHSSDDVSTATATMFTELEKLGIENFRGGIAILLHNRTQEVWSVNNLTEGKIVKAVGTFNIDDHSFWQHMYKEWGDKKEFLYYFLAGKEKEDYVKILSSLQNYLPQSVQQFPDVHLQVYFFGEGAVWTNSLQPHSEEDQQVMKRFTSVFSLTFRRYQDLKKAEAQAREAQIEASLERVRARTMAMHSSEDVTSATETMFEELKKLGIDNLRCGIANIHQNRTFDVFGVTNLAGGNKMSGFGLFCMDEHPVWQRWFESWKNKEEVFIAYLAGQEKIEYFNNINNHHNYLPQQIVNFPDNFFQAYYFEQGSVWAYSSLEHSESEKDIMKRFATSFSLTFRRYQDLQKAEAQAREATIEAALERVRGKAMAMHNSKDLATTIEVFYHELGGLSLTPRRCGIGLINKETHIGELSTMSSTDDGQTIQMIGKLDLRIHPILVEVYDNWLTKTEYHPVLRGNAIKEYYQLLRPQMAFPDFPNDSVQYGYFFFFEEGGVYAWTEKELQEDELKIYRRFTSVLSLTYKRYKDLKDAEIRTQIAIKDAALDRIRADIASMRTIDDLERITPLIWNELTILGIPFIRCGVFIMDEEQQLIHTFLSTPDGKAIAAFHLPYATPGNIQQVLRNWRSKKNYIDHWDEAAFIEFAGTLVKQGVLASPELYLKTLPKGGFYLHFLPFLQGMLYVGNTTQVSEEQIELIQHVADAFSTAYARYEDFNKLEAAKQQVEKTLTDLKQAQTQLVQSEKMASLGELTAGIAHEIQNPLNFVNNFSDVSNELLEEMKTELEKGNAEDAMAIVEDIKQNLDKILHHGKRADAIVKGMLQHSRTSSGQKEPTDINILADEYLRLAFHGLRAKDKSFNARFETEFDNSIGKINIIPQDIGRVILNLINNAFYAVTEKKKQASPGSAPNGYEPVVTLITKKENGKVEIKVKDNGNGIQQKVLEKIFQPFFTTKPTGQGTGLGLSLSYDIIKAHGGEIKVNTKENEGTEFTIILPA